MPHTAPVQDWATDFDVLDPALRQRSVQHLGRPPSDLPDRAHEPPQEQLAADALRRRHRHRARHRALQLAQGGGDPRRRGRGSQRQLRGSQPRVRPAADLRRPTAAHLDAAAAPALVLAQAGGQLRADDPRALPRADRRVRRERATPMPPPTTPSRSPCGSSPRILGVPDDLSDTFTGWVRDVLEFADDAERRQRGAEGLLDYFLGRDRGRGASIPATTC